MLSNYHTKRIKWKGHIRNILSMADIKINTVAALNLNRRDHRKNYGTGARTLELYFKTARASSEENVN